LIERESNEIERFINSNELMNPNTTPIKSKATLPPGPPHTYARKKMPLKSPSMGPLLPTPQPSVPNVGMIAPPLNRRAVASMVHVVSFLVVALLRQDGRCQSLAIVSQRKEEMSVVFRSSTPA
jgi:hypothetical protein